MKILHCTDLHCSQDAMAWITERQAEYDVICLTGDFLDDREDTEIDRAVQVRQILAWFESLTPSLFVCSGNHDYFDGSLNWLKQSEHLNGDGSIVEFDGVLFGCIGYDDEAFERFHQCEVLLYHVPPSSTSCAKQNGEDWGCDKIKQALQQQVIKPKYLLTGHVHRPNKHVIKVGNTIISNSGGVHKDGIASYTALAI